MANLDPSCRELLDPRIRRELKQLANFGYIGVLIREVTAYIELLEEEIAKAETKEDKPCSS